MPPIGASEIISIASALFAFVSYLASRSTVRRQAIAQYAALRAARDADLISWANEAIDIVSETQKFCRDRKNKLLDDLAIRHERSRLRTRLQALLDRGRLFFPGEDTDGASSDDENEAAYAGNPHPSVDALYRIYRIVSDMDRTNPMTPHDAIRAIVAQRRRFVSTVFLSVDPRRREEMLRKVAV
jgi:predicted transcriptional regulator